MSRKHPLKHIVLHKCTNVNYFHDNSYRLLGSLCIVQCLGGLDGKVWKEEEVMKSGFKCPSNCSVARGLSVHP